MNRYSLVCVVGKDDRSKVKIIQKGAKISYITLLDENNNFHHGLSQFITDVSSKGLLPSENALDLLFLSSLVSAADNGISRINNSQDTWTREIDIYLPVKNVSVWQSISPVVERTLHFLTGDIWRIFLRERSFSIIKNDKLPLSNNDSICLFSGGLDSFVGAIDLLCAGKKPLLISSYGDNSTSRQPNCKNALSAKYGFVDSSHIRANVHFKSTDIPGAGLETTQRARSFLFFALAAFAASGFGTHINIFVPENGLISINVPLDPLRVGAWSTRTTHPFYMARWNEIINGLSINAALENPYRFKTKGEMLKECKDGKLLYKNLPLTLSCSSVSKARWKKINGIGHCGYCLPCLIRRAAIEKAFPNRDSTVYSLMPKLAGITLSSGKAEGETIRSFQFICTKINNNPKLSKYLIYKPGPLKDYSDAEISHYNDVFLRGINEVHEVIKNTKVVSA